MKRKTPKSSWYKLGMVYGGIGFSFVNPILGVAVAAVLYKLEKSQKALEDAERELRFDEERKIFKAKFFARQRYRTYQEYLISPVWREKRGLVIVRASGRCETEKCANSLEEVHHKYYPRVWGTEEIDSLIGLCEEHHREAHGLRTVMR
jgi:hypothetical protein